MRWEFRIKAMGKVRQTRADAWKKRPVVLRYRETCDALRTALADAGVRLTAGDGYHFRFAMPKSWPKKLVAVTRGVPHMNTPDIDNLVGFVLDAALPDGDAHIWRLGESSKVWWDYDAIIVERAE